MPAKPLFIDRLSTITDRLRCLGTTITCEA